MNHSIMARLPTNTITVRLGQPRFGTFVGRWDALSRIASFSRVTFSWTVSPRSRVALAQSLTRIVICTGAKTPKLCAGCFVVEALAQSNDGRIQLLAWVTSDGIIATACHQSVLIGY